MKRLFTLGLTLLLFHCVSAQDSTQQILLFTQTFDNGISGFVFDSAGPGGNYGNNDWIVNSQYNGQPLYINTPSEDSVFDGIGQINNAPFSNYLHIHDITTDTSEANSNWNTSFASDRFVYTGGSFCTLGLTDVTFSFFWLCEGDSSAYGQVYYRSDANPWTQIGRPKYNAQHLWKYELIQDTALNNKNNIQVGFRWVNPDSTGPNDNSFAVDDVFAIGNYVPGDSNSSANLSIEVLNSPICQTDQLEVYLSLSQPLCDGDYDFQLSDANGSFTNFTDLGYLVLGPTFTSNIFTTLNTPSTALGNCYRLRVVRTAPAPVIVSDTSFCIAIQKCPPVIFNVQAPMMTDADTACVLSEIDVFFNSTGVFAKDNQYIAVLSDSGGNFTDSTIIGTLPSGSAFPDPLSPGDIGGTIPSSVPAGCNYYIKVIATDPPTVGNLFGPYCLKHCDELSKNEAGGDIQLCLPSGTHPSCDTLNIHPHQWNNKEGYDTCNTWTVELYNIFPAFTLANYGFLGVFHDSIGGNFTICLPSNLDSLPFMPGTYYLRITSSCDNFYWDSTGALIRITIGAPGTGTGGTGPAATISVSPDTFQCAGKPVSLTISPYNMNSQYYWTSNLLNNAKPFSWPYNPLNVNISANTDPGEYTFYVQEENYGCYGPQSPAANIFIQTAPSPTIAGPSPVCRGDTDTYSVTFLPSTFYEWDAPPGVNVLDGANSASILVFDSVGTFSISNSSTNGCGTGDNKLKVTVAPAYFSASTGPDQQICPGDTATLQAAPSPIVRVLTSQDTGSSGKQGGMFIIRAHSNITIDSFAVRLQNVAAGKKFGAQVYGKAGTYLGFEEDTNAWTLLTQNSDIIASAEGSMTVIPASITWPISAGDSFAFYVTTSSTPAADIYYGAGNGFQGTLFDNDKVIDFIQGTVNNYGFGTYLPGYGYVLNVNVYYTTQGGFNYVWSNGDSTPVIQVSPSQYTNYRVRVEDGNCVVEDTVSVTVNQKPAVYAGPDTSVCPNTPYLMPAQTNADSVMWQPGAGLSATGILNPVFNDSSTYQYTLVAIDTQTRCRNQDSVIIRVPLKLSVGPAQPLCDGGYDTLHAITTGVSVMWQPGNGLDDSTSFNPTIYGAEAVSGTYTVTATDSNGCKLSRSVDITITGICHLHVPEAFTPNGDGKNDYFTVFVDDPEAITSYEIKIFNRWGEMVYGSTDISELNDLERGWDGTYKGKKQDTDTFVYYVSVTDHTGKKAEAKGNVTLIR